MIADGLSRIAMSSGLASSLSRATDFARANGHAEVGLEHTLLALCDDPDAVLVLAASNVNVSELTAEVGGLLAQLPTHTHVHGELAVAAELRRILEAAAAAARGGRRREINGAIVLAAIVGDGKSVAAQVLSHLGMTFEGAIRALQANKPPEGPARPKPAINAEPFLAGARERVQSRSIPSHRELYPEPEPEPEPEPVEEPHTAPPAPEQQASLSDRVAQAGAPFEAPPMPPPPPPRPPMPEFPGAPALENDPFPPAYEPAPESPNLDSHDEAATPIEPELPPPAPDAGFGEQHDLPAPALPSMPPPMPASAPFPPPIPPPGGHDGWAPPPAPGSSGPRLGGPPPPPPGRAMPPPMPPVPGGAPSPARAAPPPLTPWPETEGRPQGIGSGGRPSLEAPAAAPAPAPKSFAARAGVRPSAVPRAEIGQLVENIPRAMRVAVTAMIEVRVARAHVQALAEGLQGGGAAYQHEVMVTQAMTVRLRAPDGGFFIEMAAPETQWIEKSMLVSGEDFASWRWHVTPREAGKRRLQLIISARTASIDGVSAETALPDQVITVRVRTNYGKAFARWVGWGIAAVVGGLLAKFGEGAFSIIGQLTGG